jgi:DNA-binding phage protein
MARATLTDLIAFLAVVRERSFTRAAAQLGMSQPALSRTIRKGGPPAQPANMTSSIREDID